MVSFRRELQKDARPGKQFENVGLAPFILTGTLFGNAGLYVAQNEKAF